MTLFLSPTSECGAYARCIPSLSIDPVCGCHVNTCHKNLLRGAGIDCSVLFVKDLLIAMFLLLTLNGVAILH